MRLLLDTNRYAALVAHDLEVAARVHAADEVWLSLISVGELLAGFAHGTRREKNELRLAQAIELQGIGVVAPDLETARRYAVVWGELKRAGNLIPTNDIWIAALALQHDLVLDSRDEHFQRVSGLRLV